MTARACILVGLATACSAPVPSNPAYDPDVAAILDANCVRCHSATTAVSNGNCVELDTWNDGVDPSGMCSPLLGVHSSTLNAANPGLALVAVVEAGMMPKDGPALTARQKTLLEEWAEAGYPKNADNAPPTIDFITPPAGGATINTGGVTTYDIKYDVEDPDGDAVTWTLTWMGSNGKTGTFATALAGGTGTVHADTGALGTGTYQLIATLDDGNGSPVSVTAPGTLTVPAGYNAAPTVSIIAPTAGKSFYDNQPITVSWLGNDDGPTVTCTVVGISGSTTVTIASNVSEPSGQMAMATWTPPMVAALSSWTVKVTVAETDGTQTATATSGAFSISPPPQNVSFKTQIAPLFQSSTMNMDGCTKTGCHGATNPQQGLNLTTSVAYQDLVNVPAGQCASEKLVDPGSPDTSYLVTKLVGSGTCMTGSIMPKGEAAYSATNIQLIRDWIANGAPNN